MFTNLKPGQLIQITLIVEGTEIVHRGILEEFEVRTTKDAGPVLWVRFPGASAEYILAEDDFAISILEEIDGTD